MLTKLNVLILNFLFFFVTLINASAESNLDFSTPHAARIIVSRAIVYSDEMMSTPIGYISNNKLITVGNPRKKNRGLLPTIVYGRIAFIEASNLQIGNKSNENENRKRGGLREHNIDILLPKAEENLFENNSIQLSLHQFSAGEETKTLGTNIDGSDKNIFLGFGISFVHRQLPSQIFWGIGYEYNKLSTSNLNFSAHLLKPIIGFTPVQNSHFILDLSFSLDASLNSKLTIENNLADEPTPFLWGPHLESQLLFFPQKKYHLIGSLGYRLYNVLKIDHLVDSNDSEISGITKINGINIGIGLAYEI